MSVGNEAEAWLRGDDEFENLDSPDREIRVRTLHWLECSDDVKLALVIGNLRLGVKDGWITIDDPDSEDLGWEKMLDDCHAILVKRSRESRGDVR